MKYQYPSKTILKRVNVLAQVDKPPYKRLLNKTPLNAYNFTVHVRTMTLEEISHK